MRRWRDSLFARLLVMQGLLTLALVALLAVVFYAERNITVSRLLAERWAPSLRAALNEPADAPGRTPAFRRLAEAPAFFLTTPPIVPRMAALRETLAAHGVVVERVAIGYGEDGPQLWLRLAGGGASPWFRVPGDEMLPNLPLRGLIAFAIALVCVLTASVLFTRRLVTPLRRIDAAMRAQRPEALAGEVASPNVDASAPPELRAIDAAWLDLLARYQRHESERALLLAGVSHDLRGPLARIRMAADMLPDDAVTARRRESIVRNVAVADGLIESFLDHVRAGELPLDQRCDLAAIARQVVARSEHPPHELQIEAPTDAWIARANAALLERAFTNLIDNAFLHGKPPVRFSVRACGDAVTAEVTDHGSGIAPEDWERATRAFGRGDPSRGIPGSGLGLANVARVARRLGGTLTSLREPGRFSVRLTLPR
jgi:two-component system osmolarity sensor histidine kinase EnvZ